jgi:anti-sigma B factor antagonist
VEVTVRDETAATVVVLSGSLDGTTAEGVSKRLSELVSGGGLRLVVDFAGVGYVSSAGLRVLLGSVKETRREGGDLRLAAVRPEVRKVLDLSGFTSILKLFPTVDEALASFGSTR